MTSGIHDLVLSVPTEQLAADLEPLPDGVEVVVWDMTGDAPRAHIDIVVPPYMNGATPYDALASVGPRLVQGQSIGYEGVEDKLPSGLVFANAATVHETSTAELAVGLILAAQRHIDDFAVDTRAGVWKPQFAQSLADRRVLLIGYGGVGKAIAARLAPFEAALTAVARSARDEDGMTVHAIDELDALLADAEIVVLSLPGGEETRGILDARTLALLPDRALVVNVGRGSLIDTDALVAEVSSGRLRAALDVVDPEPLPEGHPLWGTPGVLISPHVGGASSAMRPRIAALITRQVERMLAGEEPANVVVRS
ncbi:2-hydroxyacid dehydrogenase [Microbacterium sp. zg.Y1090]|uniref:2-hydroxyacid dehydrogenase n=1 Tax=Microbacterium TaxID=33882 RepID=UPI00214AE87F|nr:MULTISPECIES: 2-hydroxyacid dehydrogenase [unclassified Microbacterium]MCR2813095.1 2-hydroxyacid dehydrogenase [Microbacterium sp. zg.Y1084]MCR2819409.1 2-hydroxyacid dehydrogenase [Microbacterium sp. zg.Y1090]MDL5487047.1 2-hydroxyacid dehydrogenase [Microbacterium sp. zg-Y1211]WIM28388.1 2-hydroxyacid dehydrogenase [Microbacterium sp. zg-Y1090]